MSKQTIPEGMISTEYLTSTGEKAMQTMGEYRDKAMQTMGEYSDKATEKFSKLFGRAKNELCDKAAKVCGEAGLTCFDKKKLGTAVIILVIIAVILCIVAAVIAYYMGKQYAQVDEENYNAYPNQIEPYIDYEGEGINYQ